MGRSPLLVLDTNVARFPPHDSLTALRAKGFRLTLSATVVAECMRRALVGPNKGPNAGKPDAGIFWRPMRTIAPYLDPVVPMMPTKAELYALVTVADRVERERAIFAAAEEASSKWRGLMQCSDEEILQGACIAADELGEDGDFSTRMNAGRGVEQGRDWRDLTPMAHDHFDRDPMMTERLHVVHAVMCLRTSKMLANADGFKDRKPNDTADLHVVSQVGLGAFVATGDLTLIADIRESGTYQAPWIRTVPEFLAVEVEDLPRGMPYGAEARREAEHFYASLAAAQGEGPG